APGQVQALYAARPGSGQIARDRRPAHRHARGREEGWRSRAFYRKPRRLGALAGGIDRAIQMRWVWVLFGLISYQAAAQYSGPGVETCLAYARKDVAQWGTEKASVVFDRDANLTIERYTRKVGSQFVSSLLLGNGAIVSPKGVAVEMTFICL